jgi:asparagine synthase (glutamine-hydrolysing)
MCGILGWVREPGRMVDEPAFERALLAQRHRGPDDEGYLSYRAVDGGMLPMSGRDTVAELEHARIGGNRHGGNVLLGHRRLSIIDLSPAGHQPMQSRDGRYSIVYNGEVYNYVELRSQLERLGHQFSSTSDTEVVLAAYREWGAGMLPRLVGMFAMGILDVRAKEIFVAKDFFGIKPLYVWQSSGDVAFASEIRSLLHIPGVQRRAEPNEVFEYVRYGERAAGPRTMLAGIMRVPAAHHFRIPLERPAVHQPTRYWNPATVRSASMSFPDAVAATRAAFLESTRLHLRSDVPIGTCLSGGVDSSAIVAAVRQITGGSSQIDSFSYISEDARYSEERYVDLIEGVRRHKTRPTAADASADVEEFVRAQELPFGSMSPYAQFKVFQLAKQQGIKVMLDGQGADEIFGGYTHLIGAKLTGLLAGGRVGEALRLASRVPNTVARGRVRTLAIALGRLLPRSLQHGAVALADGGHYPVWLKRNWFERRGVKAEVRPHGRGRNALREEILLGLEHLTLPHLLRYEDSNSMWFSIESRVPFCNPSLVELALSLPDDYLISNAGTTKAVLRAAVTPWLPREILERPKLGFHSSDRLWLRGMTPWIDELLGSEHARQAGFLDLPAARLTIDRAVRSEGYWPPYVWRILCVLAWARANSVTFD